MKKMLKKCLMTLALIAGFSFMAPTNTLAHDGYIVVKDKKTGKQHVYELNYDGWVYYVGNYTLISFDEGKTWYIINY